MTIQGYLCSIFIGVLIASALPADQSVCFAEEEVCFYCGMFKSKSSHSWVVIEDEKGLGVGACSMYCAAIDMIVNKDMLIKAITVADYNTNKQIDAYRAHWVIGGDLPGATTLNAKWAFEEKSDAEAFIKQHGGKLSIYEEVIRTTFRDLYDDTIAIKRKLIMQKMKQDSDSN